MILFSRVVVISSRVAIVDPTTMSATLDLKTSARKSRIAGRVLFAALLLCMAAMAVLHYLRDQRLREPAEEFIRAFNIDDRRPMQARVIRNKPTADLTYEVAGDIAVNDSLGEIPLSRLDEASREIWMKDIGRIDEELAEAQRLLLGGLAERPGWAYHRSLLGVIDFIRREGTDQRWLQTLELAMKRSPADAYLKTFVGYATIDSWDNLDEAARARAGHIFRPGLADPDFVSNSYTAVVQLLGSETAASLIPDLPDSLDAGIDALASEGEIVAAATLYVRWERAEWRKRLEDLDTIRRRSELNDADGLRQACDLWIRRHDVHAFDTDAGRQQAAEVLELCPSTPARWTDRDSRGEIVRFFMSGRLNQVDPRIMERAIEGLSGVPATDAAAVALAAGDLYTAEELADSAGSSPLSWTRFLVALARHRLEGGDAKEAAEVFARIAPSALRECEVAVIRQEIAAATGRADEVEDGVFLQVYPSLFWSETGVPVCIDPEKGYDRLAVFIDVKDSPALISYGFDGGRSRTRLLAPGRRQVVLPLEKRTGRHLFSYELTAGGAVQPDLAVLE